MLTFLPDQPQRMTVTDEVHPRPPEPLGMPAGVSDPAELVETEMCEQKVRHLRTLRKRCHAAGPPLDATRFRATSSTAPGALRLRRKRHGEFSGCGFSGEGLCNAPFDAPAVLLPPVAAGKLWLAGRTRRKLVAEGL